MRARCRATKPVCSKHWASAWQVLKPVRTTREATAVRGPGTTARERPLLQRPSGAINKEVTLKNNRSTSKTSRSWKTERLRQESELGHQDMPTHCSVDAGEGKGACGKGRVKSEQSWRRSACWSVSKAGAFLLATRLWSWICSQKEKLFWFWKVMLF